MLDRIAIACTDKPPRLACDRGTICQIVPHTQLQTDLSRLGERQPRRQIRYRRSQHLLDPVGENELHFGAHVVWQFAEVLLVLSGQDDAVNAGSAGGQNLLFHAADRQHESGQRDFAGHRRVAARGGVGVNRGERRRHRDAGGGAVFRNRARRDVYVNARSAHDVRVDAHPLGVGPNEALRGLGRFLHYFAQMTGQRQTAPGGQQRRLDVEHVAAGLGPRQAGCDARRQLFARELEREAFGAEHLGQIFDSDDHGRRVAFGEAQRDAARQTPDGAFELAHARLARVAPDDVAQSLVGQYELLIRQPALFQLARDEVAVRDLHLLLRAVTAQPKHLHAIEQRRRNRVGGVGGGDEEGLREVEWQVEVVVAESVVLRRV